MTASSESTGSTGQPPNRSTVGKVAGGFWRNNVLFNTVAFGLAAVLAIWAYSSAFENQFRCQFLIVDQVDAPQFMCDGADIGASTGVAGAVDSVANALGLGGDDESVVGDALTVPGLSNLIDGPLEVVRKIGVVATLVLMAATSAAATWVFRHLREAIRLLKFDRQAWGRLTASARIFISFFLAMLVPFTALAMWSG